MSQRTQARLDVVRRAGRQAGLDQRLGNSCVVVREDILKPDPILALACTKQVHQPVGQQAAHAVRAKVRTNHHCAIGVQAQE